MNELQQHELISRLIKIQYDFHRLAIAVQLKNLSNFWKSLEMSSINCKVELKFKWPKQCILATAGNNSSVVNADTIIFIIKDIKCAPAVTRRDFFLRKSFIRKLKL